MFRMENARLERIGVSRGPLLTKEVNRVRVRLVTEERARHDHHEPAPPGSIAISLDDVQGFDNPNATYRYCLTLSPAMVRELLEALCRAGAVAATQDGARDLLPSLLSLSLKLAEVDADPDRG
jgi:hypothetical protein